MPSPSAISLTFPPAEKIRPAPVRMTARMSRSALTASTAASKASMNAVSVIAFPLPGWLIVQTCTAPLVPMSSGLSMTISLVAESGRSWGLVVARRADDIAHWWRWHLSLVRVERKLQRLGLEVFLESCLSQFPAHSRALVSAERRDRVVGASVDVELSRADGPGDRNRTLGAACPHRSG